MQPELLSRAPRFLTTQISVLAKCVSVLDPVNEDNSYGEHEQEEVDHVDELEHARLVFVEQIVVDHHYEERDCRDDQTVRKQHLRLEDLLY